MAEGDDRLARSIVEDARDAVIYSDREGLIRLWNAGAERMFGYSKAEALGRSLDLIIPESLRSRHWEGYHRVMAEGRSRYQSDLLAVPAQKKDGGRISVELTLVPVQDAEGRLQGLAAIMRDVTERWNRDKAMRQRLAQLEAQCPLEPEMEEKPVSRGLDLSPVGLTDADVYEAMKSVSGYIDITPADFKELYCIAFQHAVDRFARSTSARATALIAVVGGE